MLCSHWIFVSVSADDRSVLLASSVSRKIWTWFRMHSSMLGTDSKWIYAAQIAQTAWMFKKTQSLLLQTECRGSFTMISSKAVDDGKIVPQCTLIFTRCKSWSNFTLLCTKSLKVIDSQEQMVRRHLTRHWQTHQLGALHHLNLSSEKSTISLINYHMFPRSCIGHAFKQYRSST